MKINIAPFSINKAWQGRRFATKAYKDWTEDMLMSMPRKEMVKGNISVNINLYLKSIVRGDIDNFLKPIMDCMVKKGWIEDDRYIQEISVKKIKTSSEEFIEIEII